MYEHCPVCHFLYEREEGFFTGATAINLVVAEFIVVIFIVPVAIWAGTNPNVSYIPLLLLGAPLPILLPFLFFRHSRSIWLSMSYWLDPPLKE
ncbi:MAG: DUF983 domain-containing protein [Chloroflexi bacterium]|nr:DUF983 domain-containing protein [Chloroflexota bacterium]